MFASTRCHGWLGELEGVDLILDHARATRRQATRLADTRGTPLARPARTRRATPRRPISAAAGATNPHRPSETECPQ